MSFSKKDDTPPLVKNTEEEESNDFTYVPLRAMDVLLSMTPPWKHDEVIKSMTKNPSLSLPEKKVRPKSTSPSSVRKINPVYSHFRQKVKEVDDQLHSEWKSGGDARKNLAERNKGVRCCMNRQNILSVQELALAKDDFSVPSVRTALRLSSQTAVEEFLSMDFRNYDTSMVVMYVPDKSPCATIYGGIPHELTDLVLRSTLLWQLKSNALHLSETSKACELYATTSFYLPNVQVRAEDFSSEHRPWPDNDFVNMNLTMMSDVESVLKHWEQTKRPNIKINNLIQLKLTIPLMMALRQNQNRTKLGLSPIRRVIFGDLTLRSSEKGVNSLFSQRLKDVLEEFNGCFDEIVVCCPRIDTRMHLQQFCRDRIDSMSPKSIVG